MDINLTTPSLLFPTVSLLLLAYTNRFLALANLVRKLYEDYKKEPHAIYLEQIHNLRGRLTLIRLMQGLGVLSLFFCTASMLFVVHDLTVWAWWIFVIALVTLLSSLALSVWEIQISGRALQIMLRDLEEHRAKAEKEVK